MAEEIKVKVDLEATEKGVQSLKARGAFSKQDAITIDSLLQRAKNYPALDKMGEKQLSEFKKVLKDIDTLVNKAVAKVANFSPAYKEQKKKTTANRKKVDDKISKYDAIRDKEKQQESRIQTKIDTSGYKFRKRQP